MQPSSTRIELNITWNNLNLEDLHMDSRGQKKVQVLDILANSNGGRQDTFQNAALGLPGCV